MDCSAEEELQVLKAIPGIVLAIALSCSACVMALASDKVPPAVQAEFARFMTKFRVALKANDAAAVAALTKLPFPGDASIGVAAQFQAKTYKESFSPKNRACIRRGNAIYALNDARDDTYAIFCGQLIFTFTRTPAGFLLTDIDMND